MLIRAGLGYVAHLRAGRERAGEKWEGAYQVRKEPSFLPAQHPHAKSQHLAHQQKRSAAVKASICADGLYPQRPLPDIAPPVRRKGHAHLLMKKHEEPRITTSAKVNMSTLPTKWPG